MSDGVTLEGFKPYAALLREIAREHGRDGCRGNHQRSWNHHFAWQQGIELAVRQLWDKLEQEQKQAQFGQKG
jgi:hypothetical protein